MKNPLYLLFCLFLGLSLYPATALQAQESKNRPEASLTHLPPQTEASTETKGEEEEELEWMVDGLFLSAETIGIEADELFAALAHGLSMADVAKAHGVNPIDLLDLAVGFEERDILDELLQQEIDLHDAELWREEATTANAWLLFEEDPFGVEDIVWLLDGAAEACDLSMMELAEWLHEGASVAKIAEELDVDLEEVADLALDFLEQSLDVMLVLEELDQAEANDWLGWSEESMQDRLHDTKLFETVAQEVWADEMVATLADMMDLGEEELWQLLEEDEDLQDLLTTHEVLIENEKMAVEIQEFIKWWNEDDFEENQDREDF